MILPTSITPWYIWSVFGVFGTVYAVYIMIYDKKNSLIKKAITCSMLFLIGFFITAHSILNHFEESNNIIVVMYHRNKNLIDNVVMSMLIIAITVFVVGIFYKEYILANTRKEKYKYIFMIIMFILGIVAMFVLKLV